MRRRRTRIRFRALVLAAAVLAALTALPAAARPGSPPVADVQPLAGLAPDGRSIAVQVLASCAERWTVVEAVVTVSQPGGSGRASFPLTCIGSLRGFHVVVPATSGAFALGEADVTATVVVSRGRTERASETERVAVEPRVDVQLADSARLGAGGASVTLDVTVACPVGTTGLESRVGVFQNSTGAGGVGTYVPRCDGSPHAFAVEIAASQGAYVAGTAQALTFADVVWEGRAFSGVDDDGALELVP